MSTEVVRYRDWVFEVSRLETEQFYSTIDIGGAESCACGNCKRFVEIRDVVFPEEVKGLFNKLGVDITKDYEVCDYGSEEEGHHFNGWFHFIGKINKGEDCKIPLPQGGCTFNPTLINENFEIGFSNEISISYFKDRTDLIEINFFAKPIK